MTLRPMPDARWIGVCPLHGDVYESDGQGTHTSVCLQPIHGRRFGILFVRGCGRPIDWRWNVEFVESP